MSTSGPMALNARQFHHPTLFGNVTMRAHYGENGVESVEIIEADPRVLISGHLLREVHRGEHQPTLPLASIDKVEVGGVFRIHGSNRTLVYVLTEYEPLDRGCRLRDTYVGEWPD